jgi:hypothetical protein
VDVNIDSTIRLSYVGFPVQLTVLTNQPQKIGLVCRAGIIPSVFISGKYDYTGNLSYWGRAPDIDGDTLYLTELGFYEKTSHSGNIDLKRFFLSGTLSLGINIPLAYFTTLQIGPVIHVSFTDMAEKSDYYDIFGTKYDHKPVSLNYLGLEICVRFL